MTPRLRVFAPGSVLAGLLWLSVAAPISCATSAQQTQDAGPPSPGDSGSHKHKDATMPGENCGAVGQKCCAPPTECQTGAFCNETQRVCKNQHPPDIGQPCASSSSCSSGICGYTQISDASSLAPDGNGTPPPNSTGCTVGCNNTTECTPGWTCQQLVTSGGICVCNWAPEICDGLDNNCDGIIDNEPEADNYCTMMDNGIPQKCVKGGCRCVTTCEGSCVDPMTDDNNCGKCGHACKPMVERCVGGSCGCAFTVCSGQCVNTGGNDPMNCGGCGVPCSYTCAMGNCGPVTLASSLESPGQVAADATNVYWIDESSSTFVQQVQYCPVGGCGATPNTLAAAPFGFGGGSHPDELALTVSNVYFTDESSGIETCPIAGCGGKATTYSSAAGYSTYVATDAMNVYWSDSSLGTIYRCPIASSCASPQLVVDVSGETPTSLAVSGSNVYWYAYNSMTFSYSVLSASISGGGPITDVCSSPAFTSYGIVIVGNNAYFADGFSAVYTCDLTKPGTAASIYYSDSNSPEAVASDGVNVYWSESSFTSGAIQKCAVGATCTSPTTVASGIDPPVSIALGATDIFWTSNGTSLGEVMKFAK